MKIGFVRKAVFFMKSSYIRTVIAYWKLCCWRSGCV